MMGDKQMLQMTLFSGASYGGYSEQKLPEAMYLGEFRKWLDNLTKDVPAVFKDEVQIQFEYVGGYYGDTPYAQLTVWYLRPETDKEQAERETTETQRAEAEQRRKEQSERATYEALKRKFG